MKKKTFLITTLLLVFGGLSAAPVSLQKAQTVAVHFWNTYRPLNVKPIDSFSQLSYDSLSNLYLLTNNGQGFVIVAADDCVRPVLAYSFDSYFPTSKEASPSLRYWLKGYNDQIADAISANAVATQQTVSEWKQLLAATIPSVPISLLDVPVMVSSTWDQSDPYNRLCPYDSTGGYRTVVGCVATAMAMMMHYWHHPACGTGSYSYTQNNLPGVIHADFEHTTYMWDNMPCMLTEFHPASQINAVATISYHCGVAVEMEYGASSGASVLGSAPSAQAAFTEYFKYDPEKIHGHRRFSYSDSAWMAMVDTEMAARRPILYAGYDSAYTGGHAFVCDGSDLQSRYHFNWGWHGFGNGFYTLARLAPGVGGTGSNSSHDFSYGQQAVFGVEPIYEQFDTVEVFDSVCNDSRYFQFYEHNLTLGNLDTLLQHLDTVYMLHLRVVGKKTFCLDPNGGEGQFSSIIFCIADGALLPECTFHKDSCRFLGWCLKSSGNGTIYQPGDVVHIQQNRTFYAIWQDTTQTVGIISPAASNTQCTIYPNPTSDDLYIESPETVEQVVVIDALGRTVFCKNTPVRTADKKVKISLQGLLSGIYTLQIKAADGIYNQRIVKQ